MNRRTGRIALVVAIAAVLWLVLAPRTGRESPSVPSVPEARTEGPAAEIPPAPPAPDSSPRRDAIGEALPLEAQDPVPVATQAGSPAPREQLFSVSVVVLDAEGERVPGALVEVWNEGEAWIRRSRSVLESRTTDSSGRCTVTALSRKNVLFASKSGVGTSGDWPLGRLADDPREVTLVLRAQAKVRGLVLRADGAPASCATVSFWISGSRVGGNPRLPPNQTTDAEGRFEADLDSSGSYGLAAKEGERQTGNWFVRAKPGETKEVTLRFPGAFAITGVLLDPDGSRVAGGGVQAWERPPDGEYAHPARLRGETGTHGSFRLETPRLGEYTVAGLADGFAESEPVTVRLTEEAPTASVSLSLFPASFILGRVRRETGEPVAEATLNAWADRSKGAHSALRGVLYGGLFKTQHLEGKTAFDGTFRLEPAHPGLEYSVACVPDPIRNELRILRRGVVPGGSPVEIVVTEEELKGAVLRGAVESEVTGRPLKRFELRLSHQEAGDDSWSSDGQPRANEEPDGRFRIEGLVAGDRYAIEVGAEGHGNVLVEPWTMEASGKEIRVRLPAPAFLEVRVVDPAGRPIPFAEISVRTRSEAPLLRFWGPLRADEGGIATVRGIDPGRYEFRASKGAGKSEPVEAEVRGGTTTVVEVPLPR